MKVKFLEDIPEDQGGYVAGEVVDIDDGGPQRTGTAWINRGKAEATEDEVGKPGIDDDADAVASSFYESMTVDELKTEIARRDNVKPEGKRKEQLIAALNADDANQAAAD